MSLPGKCDDAFPASLSDLSEFPQPTNCGARAELLGKLAPRDLFLSIRGINFALWNGPSAPILVAPERSARMYEQHFEPIRAFSVGQNASAPCRSPRLRAGGHLLQTPFRLTWFKTGDLS
jgi:hypothetical protein